MPVTQARPREGNDVSEDPFPELRLELPFPGRLIFARSGPPRPRGSTPPPASTGNDTEKSEAPTIVPQLTSQESAVSEKQTNHSPANAENNFEAAPGKDSNATATDPGSKARGVSQDARGAAPTTDWSPARRPAE